MTIPISIVFMTVLIQINFAFGQNCDKLSDGKYKVRFDKQFGGNEYVLLLEGDRFTEFREGKETNGKVEVNENCTLLLDYRIKWDTTNEVQKLLSKSSKPHFEFEKTRGRKIRFRLTGFGGPHTTAGEGIFAKVN